jgi:hypothetical protein
VASASLSGFCTGAYFRRIAAATCATMHRWRPLRTARFRWRVDQTWTRHRSRGQRRSASRTLARKGDPRRLPRQASPAWAIALLGGALAGSGPGTSPCIDGLSLVTGMVVPSTLRVQTTRTMVGAWTTWNHEADQSWCPEAGARPLGRWDSNPHGLPHRDLNCAGRVVAGGIPGAVSPLSRSDAQAPSRPVPPRPGASQRVP